MSFAEDNGHDIPLEDLILAQESVEYVEIPVWTDQYGIRHTLDSMSTEYIKRCIAKIKRENWRTSYLPLFYNILKRRYNEKVKL